MSWQLSALALVGLTLLAGLVWFERSRPSARILAAVAALAALGVAGRVALAPLPNVVATTDVALLAGYTLGGAPGFAVGALSALISNFWLGQGPWTPWQMAGWGLVGVGGAALAILTARRLGRWGLATAAALAGLLYGALLDLSVMVNFGGEQSLDRYLALSARSIPFNIAHATGNAALMLAAGPALVRMLERYRERFEVRWVGAPPAGAAPARPAAPGGAWPPVAALLGLALGVALLGGQPGRATALEPPAATTTATAAGVPAGSARWLRAAQNRDGGWGISPGSDSSVAMTGWAMLGLEAAGINPRDVRRGGRTAVDYLEANAGALRSTGDIERTILALRGAGLSVRSFAGRDLLGELRARERGDGSYERQVNLTAFAILARGAAGEGSRRLRRPAAWLSGAQNEDGGWGSVANAESEPDSTGAALQALAALGGSSAELSAGARRLAGAQNRDGGWSLTPSAPSNSQSTAWAIQGLLAAGRNPAGVRASGRSGLDYLEARRAGDGHYRYSQSSDQTPVWATSQALAAVSREAYPLDAVPRRPRPAGTGGSGGTGGGGTGGGGGAGGSGVGSDSGGGTGSRGGGAAKGEGRKREPGGRRARNSRERIRDEASRDAAALIGSAGSTFPAGDDDDDGSSLPATPVLLAGLGGMALALAGGWLLYRRRLP